MTARPASTRPAGFANGLLGALAAMAAGAADFPPELPPPELTESWSPEPTSVSVPVNGVPSDATVLFDGTNLNAWESLSGGVAPWALEDGEMVVKPHSGGIRTKSSFGDVQLHLEFRSPPRPEGSGQDRGNSGVHFMGLYEVQILDSYRNVTYANGQAGSVYKQHAPLVNASRAPGEWQTYDIVFVAPRFAPGGTVRTPARVTVFHNGVLVQHDVVLQGPTEYRGYPSYRPHEARLPLHLEDHRQPVAFRNIWIRSLALPAPP